MSQSAGAPGAPALVVRLSLPAGDAYRHVAKELATKVAGFLGVEPAGAIDRALDGLASKVAPENGDEDKEITFEFRQTDDELLIHARCAGRSSEARHRLPS
jgi:hypothetical protein